MVRAATPSMFQNLIPRNALHVIKDFEVAEPKTKLALAQLQKLKITSALIITEKADENLYLSVRNLPHVEVTEVSGIDPVSLFRHRNVVVTKDALQAIEGWLQ